MTRATTVSGIINLLPLTRTRSDLIISSWWGGSQGRTLEMKCRSVVVETSAHVFKQRIIMVVLKKSPFPVSVSDTSSQAFHSPSSPSVSV